MEANNRSVAVVTGVGPGLGAALARRFAQGYAVAINARRADYLRRLKAEIGAPGRDHSRGCPPISAIVRRSRPHSS